LLAAKELLDLCAAHPIKIIGYDDLSAHESQPPDLPGLRRIRAVTLTSGLPALAITNGSPLAARSTSRDRWVLAS
jgi:hypothetical protein